jgi:hypothetical protein
MDGMQIRGLSFEPVSPITMQARLDRGEVPFFLSLAREDVRFL